MAIVVAIVQVVFTRAAADNQDPVRDLDALGYLLLLAGPAALVVRRRAPVVTLAVALTAADVYVLAGYPGGPFFVAAVLALFSAVSAGHRVAAWVCAGGAYAVLALGAVLPGVPEAARPSLTHLGVVAIWLAVFLALAEAVRVRSEQLAQQARYRAAQEHSRAEQQRRQASEERLRIARELHDVLGHHLSLINVQAGVGLHLMDSQPEQAREALSAIKTASAEALREVRAVLGVLRPEEEAAPRAPAPGLDRLADLTAEAGLPVAVRVRGTARPLPAEVDRAAYRIVQEALTNVRRHAGAAATATVTIAYGDSDLTVRVDDDGQGATGAPPGSGIAGMRARATGLGGDVTAGPRAEGGFRVEARLPVEEES
jgi:signal transduction histidine kinase